MKQEAKVLLQIDHMRKSFDGLGVLKDISLCVREGEVVSIIGPSGSGNPHSFDALPCWSRWTAVRFAIWENRRHMKKTENAFMLPRRSLGRSESISDWFSRTLIYFLITV